MSAGKGLLSIFRKGEDEARPANNLPGAWVPPELPGLPATSPAEIPPRGDGSAARATVPGVWVPPAAPPLPSPAVEKTVSRDKPVKVKRDKQDRPRLVFAFDATSSRSHVWSRAIKLADALLRAVPDQLDVALAVHGGGLVHTFTPFTSKLGKLRDTAAGVRCQAGGTRLLDILARVLKIDPPPAVVLYIGDAFEENEKQARRMADALLAKETRVIILHDGPAPRAFGVIAERSGGALLPFNARAVDKLDELLGVVAVLAVGGIEAVEEQAPVVPAANELLHKLDPSRLLLGRG
jgi:hypothetical protein